MLASTRRAPQRRREPVYVCFLFLVLSLVFYWPIAFSGQILASYDLLVYFYPYRDYAAMALRGGELPLWNPYLFLGAPILANIQTAVLYPFNLLTTGLPAPQAVSLSIVVHVFLAGVFMYAFARTSLKLPPISAFASGAVFMFSGFISQQVGHPNQLNAAIWIPLLFLLLDITVRRGSLLAATGGGLIVAVQILAGHPQEVYLSLFALGLYSLFRGGQGAVAQLNATSKLRAALGAGLAPVATWVGMVLLGAGVAAVQLLPTAELAALSIRGGGLSYPEIVSFSLPPAEFLRGLLPAYGDYPFAEFISYVGFLPLALAILAATRWRSHAHTPFMVTLALISVLFALGEFGPLYPLLGGWLPGLDSFRVPARWLFVYTFAISCLAGIGLAYLERPRTGAIRQGNPLRTAIKRLGIIGAFTGAMILAFWLARGLLRLPQGPTPTLWAILTFLSSSAVFLSHPTSDLASARRALAAGIVAVILAELFFARSSLELQRTTPFAAYSTIPASVEKLLADKDSFRVLVMASPEAMLETAPELKVVPAKGLSPASKETLLEAIRYQTILAPNLSLNHRIAVVDGYDGGILPLSRYVEFKRLLLDGGRARPETVNQPDALLRNQLTTIPDTRLLGALGVKYVITDRNLQAATPELEPIYDGGVKVYRNLDFRPPYYLTHEYVVTSGPGETLSALAQGISDSVVLTKPPTSFDPPADGTPSHQDQLETLIQKPEARRLRATLSRPGFLVITEVITETLSPGWRAWVDGSPTEILPANYLFGAVVLDAGEHIVELRYQPDSFGLGWRITLGTLLLTAVLAAYSIITKSRKRPQKDIIP